jgi:signal transduction histidine kinase/DNA-binding response OmpR family regulator
VKSRLRILLLEDDARDAELIQELLEADQFDCEVIRVQTRAEFVAGLENTAIDLVLADYKLPSFDGISALRLALDARADLPFIFVSGSLGEEVAIEALKIGATDYIVKSRLSRLVPSVQRALREARERAERKKAEEAFRRSEMYLAEAQRLSRTGSFGWDPAREQIYWSNESYRIFECEPTKEPTIRTVLDRTHPDDRMHLRQILDRALIERREFTAEHRLLMADGSVKYVRVVARPSIGDDPRSFVFVGAIMDVTERNRSEEALRAAQAEVVRVSRLTTMGELVASIAHEINQPLVGVVASGNACLRWLNRDMPDLDAARDAVSRIVRDAHRAGEVIRGLRALTKKSGPQLTLLDLNDAIQEVLALARSDLQQHGIVLHTDLSADDRPVFGDRVQLQQVLLNLIMNGMEAMSGVADRRKVLAITSEPVESGGVLVAVEDTGTGLDPATAERIFDPFFTTKPSGMGMGLSICRSIIDAHGGRLWMSPRVPCGTSFRFTVPTAPGVGRSSDRIR